jgi:hypothetical protein
VVGGRALGQKRTAVRSVRYVLLAFLGSPHRETAKNVIKNIEKKIGFGFGFFERFVVKHFLYLRNPAAPKNLLNKKLKKKGKSAGGWVSLASL